MPWIFVKLFFRLICQLKASYLKKSYLSYWSSELIAYIWIHLVEAFAYDKNAYMVHTEGQIQNSAFVKWADTCIIVRKDLLKSFKKPFNYRTFIQLKNSELKVFHSIKQLCFLETCDKNFFLIFLSFLTLLLKWQKYYILILTSQAI